MLMSIVYIYIFEWFENGRICNRICTLTSMNHWINCLTVDGYCFGLQGQNSQKMDVHAFIIIAMSALLMISTMAFSLK